MIDDMCLSLREYSDFESVVDVARTLLRYPSITPSDAGCLADIMDVLANLGFVCEHIVFGDTTNLYARLGSEPPHLCFVGHVDVVPPGNGWSVDPFGAVIQEEWIYGRGAVDMKGAIAAFLSATTAFIRHPFPGSLSILLTSDEEGSGTNGIVRMIPWLTERDERFDAFLIGEPSGETLGVSIKVGRMGSLTAELCVHGKQGHIACPERADNPMPRLLHTLSALTRLSLDDGAPPFLPSHLQITAIETGNPVCNVIPDAVTARFGIRFNPRHTSTSLEDRLRTLCSMHAGKHTLHAHKNGEPFLTTDRQWIDCVKRGVERVLHAIPQETTDEGTSDGRFLCALAPVVECGLPATTMHQANERVNVNDLHGLKMIYTVILQDFFGGHR